MCSSSPLWIITFWITLTITGEFIFSLFGVFVLAAFVVVLEEILALIGESGTRSLLLLIAVIFP